MAKEEGLRGARDDARCAALGTIGLLVALTTAVLLRHHSAWLALAVATAAWTVVSLGGYAVGRAAGAGSDETGPEEPGA